MSIFSALADPTRRSIIETLARSGALPAGELARQYAISPSAISQHLQALVSSGLILRQVQGKQRIYRLAEAGLHELEQWLERTRWFFAQQGSGGG